MKSPTSTEPPPPPPPCSTESMQVGSPVILLFLHPRSSFADSLIPAVHYKTHVSVTDNKPKRAVVQAIFRHARHAHLSIPPSFRALVPDPRAMSEDDDLSFARKINHNGDFVPPDGLDHPSVIKRRFTSVLVVSALSPVFVWAWKELTGVRPGPSLLALMGIRLEGILTAATLPLLLTMVLFLGPLIQLAVDCPWGLLDGIRVVIVPAAPLLHDCLWLKACVNPSFWALCLSDMRWLRNQVVAPLTEELVFRASMLPMLVPCAGPTTAIFTCPLFFGVAHFHHVIELLRFRQGTVSTIFLSAGHLLGPVLCHSFCNYMGFPALSTALEHPQRLTLLSFYLLGVLLFLLLLFPMTDPVFYSSPTPVCSLATIPGSICS
ncbi:hypothetical protein JZ751_006964 [Albula glossodonta]|uniref:CAAX prenyl protease 2 n=1 Tax=Albula glossodonta TaxID=121402 RepID=A0A8T2NZV3_9TELE|nr:hypothetical protein JZ751_006964 [Albula glossodonta]